MLSVLAQNKRIINVDETPIGHTCFIQRAWVPREGLKYQAQQIIWPRITMIAPVDTYGKVYYALLQANSNEDMMRLFFYRLVEQLDKE